RHRQQVNGAVRLRRKDLSCTEAFSRTTSSQIRRDWQPCFRRAASASPRSCEGRRRSRSRMSAHRSTQSRLASPPPEKELKAICVWSGDKSSVFIVKFLSPSARVVATLQR